MDYNEYAELSYGVYDLEHLWAIIKARSLHYRRYQRENTLKEYLVLGKFYLDQFGQISVNEKSYPSDYDTILIWMPNCPKIIECNELRKIAKYVGKTFSFFSGGRILAPFDEPCSVCNEYWTLDNCADISNYDSKPCHKQCRMDIINKENEEQFTQVFKKAGFTNFVLEPMANVSGYADIAGDWYRVATDIGPIIIGWRKRVIVLEWNLLKSPKSFYHLFDDVEDTKDINYIHCWKETQAIDYLTRVRNFIK